MRGRIVTQSITGGAPRQAKFYSIIRSAHLERAKSSPETFILYSKTNYDLDHDLFQENPNVINVSPWQLPKFLNDQKISILEVNEPLMLPAWRVLLPILCLRLAHPRMHRPLRVVFYAIENLDPSNNFSKRLRLPVSFSRFIISLVSKLAFLCSDRIAFGTHGSMKLYESLLGSHWQKPYVQNKVRYINPLPAAANVDNKIKIPSSVLFLGDLSERKGIRKLMDGWSKLPSNHGLSLRIIGVGEELQRVKEWAASRPEVSLLVNPSRSVIHENLARAETLVLLSQTTSKWREQIGLPLLEGWSYGCNLISTSATGIADLLEEHGHVVLPENFSDEVLVDALTAPRRPRRSAETIQGVLPTIDGRLAADQWLNGVAPEHNGDSQVSKS